MASTLAARSRRPCASAASTPAISAAASPRGTLPAVPARSVPQSETEINKLGAVDVRGGVCVPPEQPGTLITLAGRIEEMQGKTCLVDGAKFDAQRGRGPAELAASVTSNDGTIQRDHGSGQSKAV